MKFDIQTSNKKIKVFLQALVPDLIAELKLGNSKKCVLISVSKNCNHAGITVPLPGINGYMIGVPPTTKWSELALNITHEMIHVKQMASGLLKSSPKGSYWANQFFPSKTPYLQRPWEIHAFQNQELVMRRVFESSKIKEY